MSRPPPTELQLAWVEKTLASLSLREKIGQTAQERFGGFPNDQPAGIQRFFAENPLGSLFCGGEIICGAGDGAEEIRAGIALCQRSSKVPLLVAGDLESGAGSAVRGMNAFPQLMALGATNDSRLAYDYGKFTALEGRAAGFNWTFAPVVDLLQNWLNPVVSNRGLGDDPAHVSRLAVEVIRGLQEHGLTACAKHFPGDGVDFRDQHLVTSVNSLSEEEWWKNHGRVFQEVVAAGVWSVMSGHIALPWRDPLLAGERRPRPATVSAKILGLLRRELGFEGIIVSDALEMGGFTGWAGYDERMVQAFLAGNDVMLWPGQRYFPTMECAIAEGRITLERLEESVRRILLLKARLGLPETDAKGHDPKAEMLYHSRLSPDLNQQAEKVRAEVAARSITLVRNEEKLLPLDPRKIRRVLVLSAVNPIPGWKDSLDPFLERLKGRNIELTIIENGNCLDVWKMEEAGLRWDACLAIFSLQIHQMKNTVRPTGPMGEVIWTLQNMETIRPVVISLGTPFLLRDMPFLSTLVNAYSASAATLEALDRVLFGEAGFADFSPVKTGGDW